MVNFQTPQEKLKVYYRNRSRLPVKDIQKYFPGGEKGHLCPFCLREHSKLYGGGKYIKRKTFRIEKGFYPKDPKNIAQGHITLCTSCSSIWDELQETKDMNTTSHNIVAEWKKRLYPYIETGLFPGDSDLYSEGYSDYGACIFCQKFIEEHEEKITLSIPQGQFKQILGQVCICEDCMSEYERHEYSNQVTKSNINSDICANCNDLYEITEEEYIARTNLSTEGKHMCDKCLCDKGLSGSLRIYTDTCTTKGCENGIHVDLTLSDDEQYFCSTCKVSDLKDVFFYEDLMIIVYRVTESSKSGVTEGWYYQVVTDDDDLIEDGSMVGPPYPDSHSAVLIGTQKAIKWYHENRLKGQRNIDEFL